MIISRFSVNPRRDNVKPWIDGCSFPACCLGGRQRPRPKRTIRAFLDMIESYSYRQLEHHCSANIDDSEVRRLWEGSPPWFSKTKFHVIPKVPKKLGNNAQELWAVCPVQFLFFADALCCTTVAVAFE